MNVTTGILDVLLAFALGLVIKYAIPFIKIKWKEFWVGKAVRWAEQTVQGSKMGAERKKKVIDFLGTVGIVVDEAVMALIEASVNLMNTSLPTK